MVKIQLAIQGGGAKIVSLLAVMETIQELQNKGELEVTNIVGTSAGSIAGAFLAAGVSIPVVKQQVTNLTSKLVDKHFSKSLRKGLTNIILLGKPVWKTEFFRNQLEVFFTKNSVKEIGDCKIPLRIIATDLTNGKVHPFERKDEPLINAIIASCGLPYFFKVWDKNGENQILVDGGICENLPSEYLEAQNDLNGEIIGISFAEGSSQKTPTNLLEFTYSLLNTAMANSVKRAKRKINKDNLFEIKTKIDTFDFDKAISNLDHEWDLAKSQAETFFRNYIESKSKPLPPEPAPHPIVFNESFEQMIEKIRLIYENQHHKLTFHYEEMKLRVTANSLNNKNAYDEVIVSLRFKTGNKILYCHRFSLKNEDNDSTIKNAEFKVFDSNNKEIKTTYLYSSENKAQIILFFDNPLPANSSMSYTIRCEAEISNMVSDNMLSLEAIRSDSPVNAEIILQIPKQSKHISIKGNFGKEIQQQHLSPRVGYNQLGWKTTKLAYNEKFKVEIMRG
jgi:predicted acylesterase/phospholipase RssA